MLSDLARGSAPACAPLMQEPSNPSDRDQAKTAPKIKAVLQADDAVSSKRSTVTEWVDKW